MTFQEIFNEDGMYIAKSFAKGFVFVTYQGNLYSKTFKDKDDFTAQLDPQQTYKGLFDKKYVRIFTRSASFEDQIDPC